MVFAWIVATVTTLGSLYYSEHAGFVPCELCWYQRIVMYPLVIVLGVAALRRDRAVWITALVFVVIGAPLSLYHWLVERVPAFEESSSCSAITPCSAPWFEKLGFVTLAWMAMSAFLLIGVLMVCTLLGARDGSRAGRRDLDRYGGRVTKKPTKSQVRAQAVADRQRASDAPRRSSAATACSCGAGSRSSW